MIWYNVLKRNNVCPEKPTLAHTIWVVPLPITQSVAQSGLPSPDTWIVASTKSTQLQTRGK